MDWIALITTLITTILPLIINKGVGQNKVAFQRRAVQYAKFADKASDGVAAAALFEISEACNCMAAASTNAEQQQILAAATDGLAAAKAQMAAAAK